MMSSTWLSIHSSKTKAQPNAAAGTRSMGRANSRRWTAARDRAFRSREVDGSSRPRLGENAPAPRHPRRIFSTLSLGAELCGSGAKKLPAFLRGRQSLKTIHLRRLRNETFSHSLDPTWTFWARSDLVPQADISSSPGSGV